MDLTTPRAPLTSVSDMRAALSTMPRDIQQRVRVLWGQGHMSAAIEIVEAILTPETPDDA